MAKLSSRFWTRDSFILLSGFLLTASLVVYFWWPLAEALIVKVDWHGEWWTQLDWLLIGIFTFMTLAIMTLPVVISTAEEAIRVARLGRELAKLAGLPEDDAEKQVKIRNIEYKPMDIEEAVLQMDLIEDNFLVFTNARSDRINVLYRRKDGHYGLIQPNS